MVLDFDMRDNFINNFFLEEILQWMETVTKVKKLSFWFAGNKLKDSGIKKLAEAIKKMQGLEVLNINLDWYSLDFLGINSSG